MDQNEEHDEVCMELLTSVGLCQSMSCGQAVARLTPEQVEASIEKAWDKT